MLGTKNNLTAMLSDRYHRGPYAEITERADAPIQDAVALMVRERLTGQAPPADARKIVDLWRDYIEARADKDLSRLTDVLGDQKKFGEITRDLLTSLEMGEDRGLENEDDNESDEESSGNQEQGDEDAQRSEDDTQDGATEVEAEMSQEELPDSASESEAGPPAEMPDDAELGDSDEAAEPWQPRQPLRTTPRGRSITPTRRSSTRRPPPRSSATPRS